MATFALAMIVCADLEPVQIGDTTVVSAERIAALKQTNFETSDS